MTWKIRETGTGDNLLYSQAGTPSLDLRFATEKSLDDYVSASNLITFTRASTGTYVDSSGVIQTATTNTPRFDHDPSTLESLGLLLEESRTNVVTNSTNPTWSNIVSGTGVNPVVTAVTDAAPDGTTNSVQRFQFDRGAGNTAADYSLSYITFTVASALYSNSLWLKSNDANSYTVLLYDAGGGIGDEFVVTPTWQRFAVDGSTNYKTSNHIATTTPYIVIGLRNDPNSGNYSTGNSNSQTADILAWGPQIEAGQFPTSYIPTSGSTVTRAEDVASITGSNFTSFFNAAASTLYVDFTIENGNSVFNRYPSGINNGTSNNFYLRPQYRPSAGFARVESIHTVTNGIRDIDHSRLAQNKLAAFVVEGSEIGGAVNGSLEKAAGADPAGVSYTQTQLSIGKFPVFSAYQIHISRLTYWPTRLSDATLQTITT